MNETVRTWIYLIYYDESVIDTKVIHNYKWIQIYKIQYSYWICSMYSLTEESDIC